MTRADPEPTARNRPDDRSSFATSPPPGSLSRRAFLGGGGAALAAVALSACGVGGKSSSTAAGGADTGTPVRGGTLKLGVISGGSTETLAPTVAEPCDIYRGEQIYDRLFDLADDLRTLTPRLALAAESDATASRWTFHLRDGVTWHDGSQFGADDVVDTIRSWQSPKSGTYGALNGLVDYGGVRKRGPLTVEVPLQRPQAQFPALIAVYPQYAMTKAGQSFADLATKPQGTGPFKPESFTPGVRSIFTANHDYWDHGEPYVDEVVIISSFTDETARFNALLSGAIDVLPNLPGLTAKQQSSSGSVTIQRTPSPTAYFMYMDMTSAPFDDVRVRQAMRLIADRPALVNDALAGYGSVANDLIGRGSRYFASDLTRNQDLEQAKSLLKSAGRERMSCTLTTSSVQTGFVEAATLFAQQAQAAGVTVRVNVVTPLAFYTPPAFPWSFAPDFGGAQGSLAAWYRLFYVSYNETRSKLASSKPFLAASAATDSAQADELWRAVQMSEFTQGGRIVWGNPDILSAVSSNVRGLTPSPIGALSNFRLRQAWLAKT